MLYLTLFLSTLVAFSEGRLTVVNGCGSAPIWIASTSNVPGPRSLKLNPGQRYTYNIPPGLASTRFWPKMYCNSAGQQCALGESGGPGQQCGNRGCAPPVDSKFEATFGIPGADCHADARNCDWWDTSQVDGYTLPYKVDVSRDCKGNGYNGADIDCSALGLNYCPRNENLGNAGSANLNLRNPNTGQIVGCYSPCSILTMNNWGNPNGRYSPQSATANPFCCPTPPISSAQCRAGPAEYSQFTNLIHQRCPHVYAYAYDDAVGLQVCPATTTYTWTLFCPSTVSAPNISENGKESRVGGV